MVSKKAAAPASSQSADKKVNTMEVDQKPADNNGKPAGVSDTEKEALTLADIGVNVALLEKSVAQLEKRFALRVLRGLATLRKRLTKPILSRAVEAHLTSSSVARPALLAALNKVFC